MVNLSNRVKILAEHQAEACRVMGNPQRVLILWLLMKDKRTASDLAEALGATVSSVHHHLRILEFHNLVELTEKDCNYFYSIKDNEFTRNCPALGNRPPICENPMEILEI